MESCCLNLSLLMHIFFNRLNWSLFEPRKTPQVPWVCVFQWNKDQLDYWTLYYLKLRLNNKWCLKLSWGSGTPEKMMNVFRLKKTRLKLRDRKTEEFCISSIEFLIRVQNKRIFLMIYWEAKLENLLVKRLAWMLLPLVKLAQVKPILY